MRRECDECGLHSFCNNDGICGDCEQENMDYPDDEEECEYGHPQCDGDCDGKN